MYIVHAVLRRANECVLIYSTKFSLSLSLSLSLQTYIVGSTPLSELVLMCKSEEKTGYDR